jgi:hypothetical protein
VAAVIISDEEVGLARGTANVFGPTQLIVQSKMNWPRRAMGLGQRTTTSAERARLNLGVY